MRLLLSYFSLHLKIKLEYKISFILTILALICAVFIELYVIESLFRKFNLLSEYNLYEISFSFSIVWVGYSIAQIFGRGFDKFDNLISNGTFDLLLIRPRNILLQVIGSDIAYEKLGKLIASLSILIYSSIKVITHINIFKILLLLIIIISTVLIFFAIYIIGSTVSFYTIQGLEILNIFTDGTKQLNQFPIDIYNKTIKVIFTYFIPITLVNYYPVKYLIGSSNNLLYTLLPLIASLIIIPSLLIFKHGLKKYKSSGS